VGVDLHDSARLSVTFVGGKTLRIFWDVDSPNPDGTAGWVSGRFHFEGLPAGTHVVSCQGYDSAPPTPATPTSWGRLKALYR
jgi:hypothetical protein